MNSKFISVRSFKQAYVNKGGISVAELNGDAGNSTKHVFALSADICIDFSSRIVDLVSVLRWLFSVR
jgi:hypothetical protein